MKAFSEHLGRSENGLFGLSFNQYCPIIIWENCGWFSGDATSWATPTSWSSLLWPFHDYIRDLGNSFELNVRKGFVIILHGILKQLKSIVGIIYKNHVRWDLEDSQQNRIYLTLTIATITKF